MREGSHLLVTDLPARARHTLGVPASYRSTLQLLLDERGMLTKDGCAFLEREKPDVSVFGHTHQSKVEWLANTLLFNPGSAGPKRFKLPRRLGILKIRNGTISPPHICLGDLSEKL
jgi:hypothetical protein